MALPAAIIHTSVHQAIKFFEKEKIRNILQGFTNIYEFKYLKKSL